MTRQRATESPSTVHATATFDVVVIGTSAGGLHALSVLLGALPDPFPVAIAFVLHVRPDHESFLPSVLSRATRRKISWAADGAQLVPGAIYAAAPGHHMVFEDSSIRLTSTPPIHFSRPSIDSLFTSAADVFGPAALAVLLTGNGSDGTAGCLAVRAAGGCVIVQDAESAEFFSMPREAIVAGAATRVLPLEEIASELTRLVRQGREYMPAMAPPRHREPL